ncbi:hypothetical protein [Burkholderia ubonensis]|uniref:hypothetical protein n=1 Tax=Burkholderia ubonensis TaxID=101571 RepID=UPI0012F9BD61|nr:hypothetical protein [Burkholderia ubonensis]
MIPRRFVHAVDSTRPYYAHRYDLFGLKIGRRLTLFGQDALDLWIRLELDPHVLAYCDRPMCIPDTKPSRLVDFWVRTFDGEKLCIRVAFRGVECGCTGIQSVSGIRDVEQGVFAAGRPNSSIPSRRYTDAAREQDDNAASLISHSFDSCRPLMPGALTRCRHGLTLVELERRVTRPRFHHVRQEV